MTVGQAQDLLVSTYQRATEDPNSIKLVHLLALMRLSFWLGRAYQQHLKLPDEEKED